MDRVVTGLPIRGAITVWLPLNLMLLLLLPGFAFYMFDVTSMAAGSLAAAALLLISYGFGLIGIPRSAGLTSAAVFTAMILAGVLVHLIIATSLSGEADIPRALQSCVPLAMFLLAARVIGTQLPAYKDEIIDRTMYGLCALFLLFAVCSVLGIQPDSPRGVLAKSVFPFTEPSHYAFSAIIPLLYCCLRARLALRVAILAAFLIVGYELQSLSLMIGILMTAIVTMPLLWLAVGLLAVVPVAYSLDLVYFTDRLDFSAAATNISSLIYIQGWELARDSVSRSSAWGIGFQQLGVGTINSAAANLLHRLLNEDSNLYDGGLTAAKYISEFGLFGVIFIGFLLYYAGKSAIYLRLKGDARDVSSYHILFCSAVIGYLLELFVRGAGYFTASGLLTLSALFYFARLQHR